MAASDEKLAARTTSPLSDSPWVWLYFFSIAALAGLFLIGPKYYARQSQVERQFQGKVRASQAASGIAPTMEMSRPEATKTSLTPLMILFAVIWICAWPLVWWRLLQRGSSAEAAEESSLTSAASTSTTQV